MMTLTKDPAVFEEKFKEITGLGSKDFNLETKNGPLTFTRCC